MKMHRILCYRVGIIPFSSLPEIRSKAPSTFDEIATWLFLRSLSSLLNLATMTFDAVVSENI